MNSSALRKLVCGAGLQVFPAQSKEAASRQADRRPVGVHPHGNWRMSWTFPLSLPGVLA